MSLSLIECFALVFVQFWIFFFFFFFKQKTAYDVRISDWSSDVCSSDLYVMSADGSSQRRISFGEGRYGTPVWSPRGDLIAFTKMYQGTFHIGVMRPDEIGRASCRKEGVSKCRSRWSPDH